MTDEEFKEKELNLDEIEQGLKYEDPDTWTVSQIDLLVTEVRRLRKEIKDLNETTIEDDYDRRYI